MKNLKKTVIGLSLGLSILLTGCGEDKRIEKDASGKIISEAIFKDNQIWSGFVTRDYKIEWGEYGDEVVLKAKELYKDGKSVGFDETAVEEFYKQQIDKNWKNVEYIPVKYVDVLIYAIDKQPGSINKMNRPRPDKVLEHFIMKTRQFNALADVQQPSEAVMLEAVKQGFNYFKFIENKNPSQEVLKTYVTLYPDWKVLPRVKVKLPDEVQMKAVQADKNNYQYLVEPSKEVQNFVNQ